MRTHTHTHLALDMVKNTEKHFMNIEQVWRVPTERTPLYVLCVIVE